MIGRADHPAPAESAQFSGRKRHAALAASVRGQPRGDAARVMAPGGEPARDAVLQAWRPNAALRFWLSEACWWLLQPPQLASGPPYAR